MALVSRKSVVLSRALRAGETIAAGDLLLMRPGTGIPASFIPAIVGKRVTGDLAALRHLRWHDIEGA